MSIKLLDQPREARGVGRKFPLPNNCREYTYFQDIKMENMHIRFLKIQKLGGYSLWGRKRAGHKLATKQQQNRG